MVNIEIIIGIVAIAVVLAVFAPLMFDPRGSLEIISCDENEFLASINGTFVCTEVIPQGAGDGASTFANENTEFRPHLVQGTNVQDPIIDFDGYKIRVMEFLSTIDGMVTWDYLVPEQYESGQDLEFTLYWFKEDGLPDTSVVPHYYEEISNCGDTLVPTTILTVLDVAEFDFVEGEDYLIMANTMWGGTDIDDTYHINVKHGNTIFEGSELIREPNQAGTLPCNPNENVYKYFWWTLYTPNATEATENLTINVEPMQSAPVSSSDVQQIDSDGDDAEESVTTGTISLTNDKTLELHDDSGEDSSGFTGLRFVSMIIPQGANVTSANIQFSVNDDKSCTESGALLVRLRGEDIDDAPVFSTTNSDISNRVETTALVDWIVPSWVDCRDRTSAQLTPDISPIIQEIVDRTGWVSGNDIVIMIKDFSGAGIRNAMPHDDRPPDAPTLTVNFESTSISPMIFDDTTMTIIKLSEHFTRDTDYFFNFNGTDADLDDTVIIEPFSWNTANDASITFTPEFNNEEWLVLGTANYNDMSDVFDEEIMTRLFVSGAETDLPRIFEETEDTDEQLLQTFARPLIIPNSTAITLEVESQMDESQFTEQRTSSAIFALNLDRFSQHTALWVESEFDIGTVEFGGEVMEIIINQISSDKDTVIITDIGMVDTVVPVSIRTQVNNVDTLPDQTINTYDYNAEWDTTDILRWGLVTVENLPIGIQTIEVDISTSDATADPDALYRSLIAFTLEAVDPNPTTNSTTSCMFLKLMSVAVGEDLSVLVSPTFGADKEVCVTTSGGADILRTFTFNFNTTEIPFQAEEVGIVKLSRSSNNTNDDFTGTVLGLFGELQWVVTTP